MVGKLLRKAGADLLSRFAHSLVYSITPLNLHHETSTRSFPDSRTVCCRFGPPLDLARWTPPRHGRLGERNRRENTSLILARHLRPLHALAFAKPRGGDSRDEI